METGEPIATAELSPPTGGVKEVKSLLSDAKQETGRLAETAKEKVNQTVTLKKDEAAEKVGSLGDALRDAGQKLLRDDTGFGRYADGAAQQADRLAQYLRSHDLGSMVRDAEAFGRRHPEVFLGGAFVAGMIATRFLKSSARRTGVVDPPQGGDEYRGGWSEPEPPRSAGGGL